MIDILEVSINAYASNLAELLEKPPSQAALTRYLSSTSIETAQSFYPLIRSLPEVANALRLMTNDHEELFEDRALAAAALNYFIMPFDAIPDQEAGAVGAFDDAYIIFSLIQKMACPSTALSAWLEGHQEQVIKLQNLFPDWLRHHLEKWLKTLQIGTAKGSN